MEFSKDAKKTDGPIEFVRKAVKLARKRWPLETYRLLGLKIVIDEHIPAPIGIDIETGVIVVSSKIDRKSTRLNSSHIQKSRMPSSA